MQQNIRKLPDFAVNAMQISESEFLKFQQFIYQTAGINLSDSKKALVCGRLGKRLNACRVGTFSEYFSLLMNGNLASEVQNAIDLLTTNETYFFREPKHFECLRKEALSSPADRQFRVWSAASSSGEEAYSASMVLADALPGRKWDVLGSDISTRVLQRARTGHYSTDRLQNFPPGFLKRFCLMGYGPQEGTLLVDRRLRERVQFLQVNLNGTLPHIGPFDVIFLRNVLIYFDRDTKARVVRNVLQRLRPGGMLFVGHSESLMDITREVVALAPSIFRKPG